MADSKITAGTKLLLDWANGKDPNCIPPPSDIGAIIYRIPCGKNCFQEVGCGLETTLPVNTVGTVELPGSTTCKTNTVSRTRQYAPSSSTELGEWEQENILWNRKFYDEFEYAKKQRQEDTWVIVTLDDIQAPGIYAFKGFIKSIESKFASTDNDDFSSMKLMIQPTTENIPFLGEVLEPKCSDDGKDYGKMLRDLLLEA